MEQLLPLNSLEDLKKVLFLQQTITRRAKNELLALASDGIMLDPTNLSKVRAFMADERKLLEKYAKYPTLTEFAIQPALADATKWGATFGVTLLVNDLIFEQVKSIQGVFESVLRSMFVLLLCELDRPQHQYLVDPLEKALRITVSSSTGRKVSDKESLAYTRQLVHHLVEAFVAVSLEYGLVEKREGGWGITPLGKRVLLHLVDAQEFVVQLTQAHARFQSEKPKLSMV